MWLISTLFQIYSTKLQISPQLSGLKSLAYSHPWIAAIIGVVASLGVNILLAIFFKFNIGSRLIHNRNPFVATVGEEEGENKID